MARVLSLITQIHLEPSLKFSGALPPLNMSPSRAHIGATVFILTLPPTYEPLPKGHVLSGLVGVFIHYLFLTFTLIDPFFSSSVL